jgi:hypothetical protein
MQNEIVGTTAYFVDFLASLLVVPLLLFFLLRTPSSAAGPSAGPRAGVRFRGRRTLGNDGPPPSLESPQ